MVQPYCMQQPKISSMSSFSRMFIKGKLNSAASAWFGHLLLLLYTSDDFWYNSE